MRCDHWVFKSSYIQTYILLVRAERAVLTCIMVFLCVSSIQRRILGIYAHTYSPLRGHRPSSANLQEIHQCQQVIRCGDLFCSSSSIHSGMDSHGCIKYDTTLTEYRVNSIASYYWRHGSVNPTSFKAQKI